VPAKRKRDDVFEHWERKRLRLEEATSNAQVQVANEQAESAELAGDTDVDSDSEDSDIQEIPFDNLVTPSGTQAQLGGA
jgi:hypothetical protein